MSDDTPRRRDDPPGPVHALIALAASDGLGEIQNWEDVQPVLLAIVRDPVGPRKCRKIFKNVNDPSLLATIEDWFNRAAAEREESAKTTERAISNFTKPVQRSGFAIWGGAGLALAVGTLALGPVGIALLTSSAIVAGGGTFVGWKQSTQADAERALAREFRRLEEIAKEERDSRRE